MNIRLISVDGEGVCLACHGDITQDRLPPDGDPLEKLLGPLGYTRPVFLDLENTPFIDSAGIGWLLSNHKRFTQAGGRLVLHSLTPSVDQVVQLLRLHTIFHLAPNLPAARAMVTVSGGRP